MEMQKVCYFTYYFKLKLINNIQQCIFGVTVKDLIFSL